VRVFAKSGERVCSEQTAPLGIFTETLNVSFFSLRGEKLVKSLPFKLASTVQVRLGDSVVVIEEK